MRDLWSAGNHNVLFCRWTPTAHSCISFDPSRNKSTTPPPPPPTTRIRNNINKMRDSHRHPPGRTNYYYCILPQYFSFVAFFLCSLAVSLNRGSVSALLYVHSWSNHRNHHHKGSSSWPSPTILSYDSLPLVSHHGKPWSHQGQNVTALLKYLDPLDNWCQQSQESTSVFASSSSSSSTTERRLENHSQPSFIWLFHSVMSYFSHTIENEDNEDTENNDNDHHPSVRLENSMLPVALLVHDVPRRVSNTNNNAYGQHPCDILDYERLAVAWNVSYIIFYNHHSPLSSYREATYFLEEEENVVVPTDETNTAAVGFQLVSYDTGMGTCIRPWVLDLNGRNAPRNSSVPSYSIRAVFLWKSLFLFLVCHVVSPQILNP
jgi:hypothetical protein